MKGGITDSGRIAILAAVLLIAGLALDLGFTQPQRRAIAALRQQRADLLASTAELTSRDVEERRLASYLGASDLAKALQAHRGKDPVNVLGEAIERSGLRRLELGTSSAGETERLRRSRLFFRAVGSYREITRLVSALEQGSRLVSIDAFTIQPAHDTNELELRMNLSFYEPKG